MRKLFFALFGIGALVGILYFAFFGFSEDRQMVNLALKTPEGTFLYTQLPEQAVALQLQQGQAPMLMPSFEVFEDRGVLYSNPLNCQALASVLAGQITLHPKPEKSFDGYLTTPQSPAYQLATRTEAAETIGEQVIHYTITLTHATGNTMTIHWTLNPSNGKLQAQENCSIRAFAIKTNPAPGETVISNQKFPVLKLEDLVHFFGNQATLQLDQEHRLLFVEQP